MKSVNFAEIGNLINKLGQEGKKSHYDPDNTDQLSLDAERREFNEVVYNINRLFDNVQDVFTKRGQK